MENGFFGLGLLIYRCDYGSSWIGWACRYGGRLYFVVALFVVSKKEEIGIGVGIWINTGWVGFFLSQKRVIARATWCKEWAEAVQSLFHQ